MANKEADFMQEAILKELVKTRVKKGEQSPSVPKKEDPMFNRALEKASGSTYKSVFGGLPAGKPDFNVKVYSDSDWTEDDLKAIPDINNFSHYFVDHDFMYPLVMAVQHNMNTLITGHTGSGKSTGVEFICAKTRQPFLRINGRQDMESDTLLGKYVVQNGNMVYIKGDLPNARAKGWLVLFDEPWKTPSGIQMALQRMYERNGVLQLDDMVGDLEEKQIKPDERARIILADNVVGTGDGIDKYAATLIQDGSTLNRMEMVLHCDYLKQKDEVNMLINKHDFLPHSWALKMVQLANLIRTAYQKGELSGTLSPRQLDTWAKIAFAIGDYKDAFNYVMKFRFASDEEKGTLVNLWNTVYKE